MSEGEYIPKRMQWNPEKDWEIIYTIKGEKEPKRDTAMNCPWGSGAPNKNVEEKTCTNLHNRDDYRWMYITFGRCQANFCPLELLKHDFNPNPTYVQVLKDVRCVDCGSYDKECKIGSPHFDDNSTEEIQENPCIYFKNKKDK